MCSEHGTAMRSVDIICPVFSEEEAISLFHARLAAVMDELSPRYVVTVRYVLDPAPDATELILKSMAEKDSRVEVLVMSRRFGHQAALIAGIDASEADAVVMLDSDLQHPPELIPELVKHWEDGADIVQMIRVSSAETHAVKRLTSNLFYQTFFSIASLQLRQGAADFRLLSRNVADIFRTQIREQNPFLRGLVTWVGFRVHYLSFTPAGRDQGRSKYRFWTLLQFALNGLCSFSKWPLRFCTTAGLGLAIISLLLAGLQVILYLLGNVNVPGWASLFFIVSFFGGVQLFSIGVLGEYIGLIFDEVKGRPRYLINQRYRNRGPDQISGADVTNIQGRQGSNGAT